MQQDRTIATLNGLIAIDRRTNAKLIVVGIGVLVIGLSILAFDLLIQSGTVNIIGIGGMAISAVSGVPTMAILKRGARVRMMILLRDEWADLGSGQQPSEQETSILAKTVEELFGQFSQV